MVKLILALFYVSRRKSAAFVVHLFVNRDANIKLTVC